VTGEARPIFRYFGRLWRVESRTGMHWTTEGAQAMLDIRCIVINGEWEDFMAFRVKNESEKLYPNKKT
jgi:hypothetical protein